MHIYLFIPQSQGLPHSTQGHEANRRWKTQSQYSLGLVWVSHLNSPLPSWCKIKSSSSSGGSFISSDCLGRRGEERLVSGAASTSTSTSAPASGTGTPTHPLTPTQRASGGRGDAHKWHHGMPSFGNTTHTIGRSFF